MRRRPRGFTLLEVMISLAILAVALVALLGMHGGAIRMYNHSKFLTVASLLARAKMVDVEEKLYADGFNDFNDEKDGTFEDEGYPGFKWKAEIVKPDLQIDTTKLVEMVGQAMGLSGDDLSALTGQSSSGGKGGPTTGTGGLTAMIGPMVAQLGPMLEQSVREIHLTISWKDITGPSNLTVVTHMVMLPGQGAPGGSKDKAQQQQNQALKRMQNLGNLPNLPPNITNRQKLIPALQRLGNITGRRFP